MRKNVFIILAITFWFIFCNHTSAGNYELTVADIIMAVSHAESLIKDISVKTKIQVYNKEGESLVPTPHYRISIFKAKGIKRYQEIEGYYKWQDHPDVVAKSHMRVAYNGETSTFDDRKEGAIDVQGFIINGKHSLLNSGYLETPEGYSFGSYRIAPLSEILKQVEKEVKIESDVVDGIPCYKITIPRVGEEVSRRIWLDSSRGFNIIRQERFNDYNGKIFTVFGEYKLEQFVEGIWFPIEAKVYSLMGKQEVFHYLVENPKQDVMINTNIPDDSFIIKFAPGTHVSDEIMGIEYTVP